MQDVVTGTLTDEQVNQVITAIKTIKELMPFLINLTAKERATLPKFGSKSEKFVREAILVCKKNPGFLPRDLDIEAFIQDFELFLQLREVMIDFEGLYASLQDTIVGAGSDSYKTSLEVYAFAKATNNPASNHLKELLGERFLRRGNSNASPDDEESSKEDMSVV